MLAHDKLSQGKESRNPTCIDVVGTLLQIIIIDHHHHVNHHHNHHYQNHVISIQFIITWSSQRGNFTLVESIGRKSKLWFFSWLPAAVAAFHIIFIFVLNLKKVYRTWQFNICWKSTSCIHYTWIQWLSTAQYTVQTWWFPRFQPWWLCIQYPPQWSWCSPWNGFPVASWPLFGWIVSAEAARLRLLRWSWTEGCWCTWGRYKWTIEYRRIIPRSEYCYLWQSQFVAYFFTICLFGLDDKNNIFLSEEAAWERWCLILMMKKIYRVR